MTLLPTSMTLLPRNRSRRVHVVPMVSSTKTPASATPNLEEAKPRRKGRRSSSTDIDDSSSSSASASSSRRRRICFIDEGSTSTLPHQAVTSINYRPKTEHDEKRRLYYSQRDFAFFALEYQYEKVEGVRKRDMERYKTFTWEDCMTVDSYDGDGEEIHFEGDETPCSGKAAMHKVKTLHDFKFADV